MKQIPPGQGSRAGLGSLGLRTLRSTKEERLQPRDTKAVRSSREKALSFKAAKRRQAAGQKLKWRRRSVENLDAFG